MKKYLSYFLILIGSILGFKTWPSFLNKILLEFNIKNTLGLDLTNCQAFGFSIAANHFFFELFIFALLCFVLGTLLLCRKQKLNIKNYYLTLALSFLFIILLFQSVILLATLFYHLNDNLLFSKHIIYTLAFIVGCLTNILFLILYLVIWFDTKLQTKYKIISLILFSACSTFICLNMTSFIYLYGVIPSHSGTTPEFYFESFNYILSKLGIGVFCMDENSINPCQEFLDKMNYDCDRARDVKSIPRIPYIGGSFTLTWIARLMNAGTAAGKVKTQNDCKKARTSYFDCIDFIRAANNKKK